MILRVKSPTISCPKLPPFAAVDLRAVEPGRETGAPTATLRPFAAADLPAVRRVFASAPVCALRQSWRTELEADFAPATVRTGWRDESLLVFAELEDADIFTSATQPNERLWELGDALEIFLRPAGQQAYSEFQVAPNNQRLQLRYASADALARARKSNSLAEALVPGPAFQSRTWVLPGTRAWQALVEIPVASVLDHLDSLPGSQWHFSFCRYDYTRGRIEPVISSTSALAQPDFHRLAEWGTLNFI